MILIRTPKGLSQFRKHVYTNPERTLTKILKDDVKILNIILMEFSKELRKDFPQNPQWFIFRILRKF